MTSNPPVFKNLIEAKEYLLQGKVGIIPTDTVYGLVVQAKNESAVARISELKKRNTKPGTIIASSIDQLVELGLKRRYLNAVEQFWPGAVSIIIPTGFSLEYLHHGLQSLPVRIPDNPELVELLNITGPLMTSSANLTGTKTASNIEEAKSVFKDKIDFYVDGGNLSERQESTIIQMNDDAIEILRHGAVKIDEETGRIIR